MPVFILVTHRSA